MRLHLPCLLVAAVVAGLLVGCSSDAVIDIPESAGSAAPAPIATPTAESTPSASPLAVVLDCEAALPSASVERDLSLPSGFVSLAAEGDGTCAYAIAGNPTAVVVTLGPGRLPEAFAEAGVAQGATAVPLGSAQYWLVGGPGTTSSELAVLAEGYELHIRSSVGQGDTLLKWAVDLLGSVDVRLTLA